MDRSILTGLYVKLSVLLAVLAVFSTNAVAVYDEGVHTYASIDKDGTLSETSDSDPVHAYSELSQEPGSNWINTRADSMVEEPLWAFAEMTSGFVNTTATARAARVEKYLVTGLEPGDPFIARWDISFSGLLWPYENFSGYVSAAASGTLNVYDIGENLLASYFGAGMAESSKNNGYGPRLAYEQGDWEGLWVPATGGFGEEDAFELLPDPSMMFFNATAGEEYIFEGLLELEVYADSFECYPVADFWGSGDFGFVAAYDPVGFDPDNESTWVELDGVSFDFTPVPEPTTMVLLGIGALSLLRRKRSV
jgi:hypothetical protein